MRDIYVSDQVKSDLIGIWEYIAADNSRAADRLIQAIVSSYLSLRETPGMGRDRNELRPGIRSLALGNYVIFYRFDEEHVFIIRVLHGARNLRAIFKKEIQETYTEENNG